MELQNNIENKLKEKGYKITKQRKSILEVLINQKDNLLSAQQIYEKVAIIYPKINFSTVYRNIEILENADIIHRIHTGEDYGNYKLREENGQDHHHHHYICKNCGKTEVLEYCPIKEMQKQLKNKNFMPTEHHFEIFGFCGECNNKKKPHCLEGRTHLEKN